MHGRMVPGLYDKDDEIQGQNGSAEGPCSLPPTSHAQNQRQRHSHASPVRAGSAQSAPNRSSVLARIAQRFRVL